MKITDILNLQSIAFKLKIESKNDLLLKMMELADFSGKITDKETSLKQIFEREKIMSTGIGQGIALPHAKTISISDTVGAFAVLDKPIDFDSLDGEPVNIVFLLLGLENNVGNHLRILSKLSRLLTGATFRQSLTECKSNEDVFKLFEKADEGD